MRDMTDERCTQTARLVIAVIESVFVKGNFPGVLNVNIPPSGEISLKNARVVPQTVQIYHNIIAEKEDIDGSACYRIVGDIDMETAPENTDVACIRQGHVALTPLRWQQTAFAVMDTVREYIS